MWMIFWPCAVLPALPERWFGCDIFLRSAGVGLAKPPPRFRASVMRTPSPIAAIPLVLIFLFTMRLFVKGLTAGAVKG
jgi:hypothetical protein